jgi:hypothetical protein
VWVIFHGPRGGELPEQPPNCESNVVSPR